MVSARALTSPQHANSPTTSHLFPIQVSIMRRKEPANYLHFYKNSIKRPAIPPRNAEKVAQKAKNKARSNHFFCEIERNARHFREKPWGFPQKVPRNFRILPQNFGKVRQFQRRARHFSSILPNSSDTLASYCLKCSRLLSFIHSCPSPVLPRCCPLE